ncbi:MAG TPA: PBP1A family penicillin-binding protein [Candidatus Binatia bacterium]|nr:PBP1A family penicillin-binding protein [Candidatus Binatia bacterium]
MNPNSTPAWKPPELHLPEGLRRKFGSLSKSRLGWALVVLAFALAFLGYDWFRLSSLSSYGYSGQGWKFPTQVYADWLELRAGMPLEASDLKASLVAARYRPTTGKPYAPGQYRMRGSIFEIYLRPFVYPDRTEPGSPTLVEIRDGLVATIGNGFSETTPRGLLRIDPQLLAEFSDEDRERRSFTPLATIPRHVALAAVASEDRRFFSHMGLDLLGIGRATARNMRAGTLVEGGSTISQQLAKNVFLSRQRTFTRKLHEALLAVLIEFRYSKEQILEFYLNQIYLGQRGSWSVCGVEEGALYYFNKHASELTLGEGALLAGIIPSPNRMSPYHDADFAIARRNEVLQDMVECGFISKVEAQRARKTPLRFAPNPAPLTRAPYFVDYVREGLSKDISERDLSTRGLRVFTTLDPRLEDAAERFVREGAHDADGRSPVSGAGRDPAQAALLAIEPQNGAIRAMVGGRDYRISPFNRAVESRRQPGSAFKPFVYVAALDTPFSGRRPPLTAATLLDDVPDSFPTPLGMYAPHNYENTYLGKVTAARALARSLNVATVRMEFLVGLPKVIEMAHALGVESRLREVASLALGTNEVTPMELTTSYATIANGGVMVKPISVRAVLDRGGNLIWTPRRELRRVIRPETAYMATTMLEGPVIYGTASTIRSEFGFTRPAAGKTGTTDDENDAWFVGYTPDLVAGVWVGCDRNRKLGLTGTQAAVPIWARFMEVAHRGKPVRDFQAPPGVIDVWIDADTGYRAGADCPHVMRESFIPTTEPRQVCTVSHESSWFGTEQADSTGALPPGEPDSTAAPTPPAPGDPTPGNPAPPDKTPAPPGI